MAGYGSMKWLIQVSLWALAVWTCYVAASIHKSEINEVETEQADFKAKRMSLFRKTACNGPPPRLPRTRVTYTGTKHNDVAHYSCSFTSDVYIKGTTQVYCNNGKWETPTILCASTTCWYDHPTWGPVYKGSVDKTIRGFKCNLWTSDFPHNKANMYKDDKAYTVDGSKVAAGSFCRLFNDSYPHAWCYTTNNNTRWDNCNAPHCDHAQGPYPEIKISYNNKNLPTNFRVTCGQQPWHNGTLINLEISFAPDIQASSSRRRQIAYLDSYSLVKEPTVGPHLAAKGVSVTADPLSVHISAGSCEDTGVYRCKAVYHLPGATGIQVKVSEARLPACLSGAIATLISSYFSNVSWTETIVCRVDPTLVKELVSLEVTMVRDGSRWLLAYINSFLNDTSVSYAREDVVVEGTIYPYNPAASSLNVTSIVTPQEGSPVYTTTCTAVYSSGQTSNKPVVSMADVKMRFHQ